MNSAARWPVVDLPRPISVFWAINLLLGGLCLLLMFGLARIRHWPYPYNFPFMPFHHWIDFTQFCPAFQYFHQLNFFTNAPKFGFYFTYPAPVSLLYESFYITGRWCLYVFEVVTAGFTALLATLLGRAMVREGAGFAGTAIFLSSVLLFSYPFWFEFLLGNMEICIFLIMSFALIAFLNGRSYLAAGLIGIAISMKIFPFVFLALFFSRKEYRQIVFSIGVAVTSTVVSLWLLCPSLAVSYHGIKWGLNHYRQTYILTRMPVETGFDHSLFGFLKQAIARHFGNQLTPHMLTAYLAFAAVTGIALYFLRIRRLPILNQLLSLSVLAILLPPNSHDYTLMHLYFPWGLLVLFALKNAGNPQLLQRLIPTFVCFAILFSPESEIILRHHAASGQLKAVTLVVLLVLSLTQQWVLRNGVNPLNQTASERDFAHIIPSM